MLLILLILTGETIRDAQILSEIVYVADTYDEILNDIHIFEEIISDTQIL